MTGANSAQLSPAQPSQARLNLGYYSRLFNLSSPALVNTATKSNVQFAMAEIVGTVGSAIAVTELAAKVVLRCAQYWKDVSNAREDIARIEKEVTNLKTVTEGVRQLCETPRGARLHTTEKLHSALKDGEVQLKGLQESLGSGKEKAVIRRLGIRSLRWPFQSKDVEKIVDGLARCTQTLSQGLQVDEM